jgi:hypothetical protein
MKRFLWMGALLAVLGLGGAALAQPSGDDPLITNPDVFIVFDDSRSMSSCVGIGGCGAGFGCARSRISAAIEVFTGTLNPFCQIWHPAGTCMPHFEDGILDLYRDYVRFGLGTFDEDLCQYWGAHTPNAYGHDTAHPSKHWWGRGLKGRRGKNLDTDRCNSNRGCLMDLVDPANPGDLQSHNVAVQNEICTIRSYACTPLAASLHDARHYFNNWEDEVSPVYHDPMGSKYGGDCRPQFVLLMTDGDECCPSCWANPLADEGDVMDNSNCSAYGNEAVEAEHLYWDLGIPVFVVAFGGGTAANMNRIARAGQGVPRASWNVPSGTPGIPDAMIASNGTQLKIAFALILDSILSGSVSRTDSATAPSSIAFGKSYQFSAWFEMGITGITWTGYLQRNEYADTNHDGVQELINIKALAPPWIVFMGADTVYLPASNSRKIITVASDPRSKNYFPPGAATYQLPRKNAAAGLVDFIASTPLADPAPMCLLDTEGLGLPALEARIKDYVRGVAGTPGQTPLKMALGPQLGDVFHASPALVGSPSPFAPDFRYNNYYTEYKNRPTMLYVAANDGMLHGFVGDAPAASGLTPLQELWGFIPPRILGAIQKIRWPGHQHFVDSTPVVRDVYFSNICTPDGDPLTPNTCLKDASNQDIKGSYRTMLVGGLRAGGDAYYALDVTDPQNPGFLWEYRTTGSTVPDYYASPRQCGPSPAQTWAPPLIGQVWLKNKADSKLFSKSVVVVPGGYVPKFSYQNLSSCIDLMEATTSGSSLHFIDAETGELLRKFYFTNQDLSQLQTWIDNYYSEAVGNPWNHWGAGVEFDSGDFDWAAGTGWACREQRNVGEAITPPPGLIDPAFCDVINNSGGIKYQQNCCHSGGGSPTKCVNMGVPGPCHYTYTEYADGAIKLFVKTDGCGGSANAKFEVEIARNFRLKSVAAQPVAYDTTLGEYLSRVFVATSDGEIWRINTNIAEYDATQPEGQKVKAYSTDPAKDWKKDLWFDPADPLQMVPAGFAVKPKRPFMVAPALALNRARHLLVYAGTGQLDNLDLVPGQKDYMYLIEEDVEFDGGLGVYVPKAKGTPKSVKDNFADSERLFGQPLVANDTVYYSTFTPSASACSKGTGKVYVQKYEDLLDDIIPAVNLGTMGTPSAPTMRWTSTGPEVVVQQAGVVTKLPGVAPIQPVSNVVHWTQVL